MLVVWLPTRQARLGHVPKGVPDGLRLEATDQAWTHGDGPAVSGPGEALALALTGRAVALEQLTGSGVEVLRARLG